MIIKKRVKAAVASISAAFLLAVNTLSAVAAPFGYSSVDDVREKALGEYLSANAVILSSTNLSVVDKVEKTVVSKAVAYKDVTETEEVNFETIKKLNPSLEAGTTQVVQEGEYGEKSVTYKVKYQKGKEISREVISETITKEPIDKIVEYGNKNASANAPVNTGKLDYKYVLTCNATAYDLSAEENGGYAGQTATGVPLDKGVIAVDPKVIPLGSRVYIEALDGSWSYGYAVAADTGGAIKGNRVDLCYRTRYECIQFGRRPCRVYVLN